MTHGTFDAMVRINAVRPQIELLRRAGLNITFREFAKDHTIAGEEELGLIHDFIVAGYDGATANA